MEHDLIWLRDLHTKTIGAKVFGELRNRVMEENGENIMVWESVHEEVLGRIGEKATFLINTLCREANSVGHIFRRNCLLH